jgi:hypothetical protein
MGVASTWVGSRVHPNKPIREHLGDVRLKSLIYRNRPSTAPASP